jgi:hypothetical protein
MAASEGAAFSGQTAGIKTMIPIHSPAPWSIRFDRIEDATGKEVARIIPRLTGEQNHKLIASAPDLLAALNGLVQCLSEDPEDYPDSSSARQVFDSIEFDCEAISKATGGVE